MKKETLRDKIVRLSKEHAECTDEKTRNRLRRQIDILKGLYTPSEPQSIGDLISGKNG
jgi:hypothetical protein